MSACGVTGGNRPRGTSNDIGYAFQAGTGGPGGGSDSPLAGVLNQSEQGRLTALYLQDRWLLGSRLLLVPGVRLTSFDRTDTRYTEPRFAATFFVNDQVKLKTATGRYYQFTDRITREEVLQGNREFWTLANGTTVPVAEATHLIGGASFERSGLLVDVELFSKDLSALTQFAPRFTAASDAFDYDDFFYHGDGTARGGEVLVQKRSGRHTGWVSYTLSKVESRFRSSRRRRFPRFTISVTKSRSSTCSRWAGGLSPRSSSTPAGSPTRNRSDLSRSSSPSVPSTASSWAKRTAAVYRRITDWT